MRAALLHSAMIAIIARRCKAYLVDLGDGSTNNSVPDSHLQFYRLGLLAVRLWDQARPSLAGKLDR